jgi:hypothetical protein
VFISSHLVICEPKWRVTADWGSVNSVATILVKITVCADVTQCSLVVRERRPKDCSNGVFWGTLTYLLDHTASDPQDHNLNFPPWKAQFSWSVLVFKRNTSTLRMSGGSSQTLTSNIRLCLKRGFRCLPHVLARSYYNFIWRYYNLCFWTNVVT